MHSLPCATVSEAFRATASRHGQRPFLHILPETAQQYGIASGELSYADGLAAVDRLTEQYRTAGYGHGHRVGLLLENRPAFFLHWLALNSLGASVVPINAELRSAELEYLIDNSEICLAVEMGCEPADIGKTIHPHPTLGESIGMAAEVFEGVCTDLPPQKRK